MVVLLVLAVELEMQLLCHGKSGWEEIRKKWIDKILGMDGMDAGEKSHMNSC